MDYQHLLFFGFIAAVIVFMTAGVRKELQNRRKQKKRDAVPVTEALLEPFSRPAIAISRGASAFSRIGGLPALPQTVEWPVDAKGKPLAFLCQIALEELPALSSDLGFPIQGALLFFYSQDQSVGGYRPDEAHGWRVVYLSQTPSPTPRSAPEGLKPKSIYKFSSLGFSTIVTYCDLDNAQRDALHINGDDYLTFLESKERPSPLHMMGGYPDNLHGLDMEEMCELASNGIDLSKEKALKSPRAVALRQRPRDWRLLLQLDSDDKAGMNWGDGGILYFWIRASDLAEKDFSKVWMIAQCH